MNNGYRDRHSSAPPFLKGNIVSIEYKIQGLIWLITCMFAAESYINFGWTGFIIALAIPFIATIAYVKTFIR